MDREEWFTSRCFGNKWGRELAPGIIRSETHFSAPDGTLSGHFGPAGHLGKIEENPGTGLQKGSAFGHGTDAALIRD